MLSVEQYKKISPYLGGEVTNNEIISKKTKKYTPDGLMSEVIFGPCNDYKCSCGRLSVKFTDADTLCSKCHVICGPKSLRYQVFSELPLMLPVIKPTKRAQVLAFLGKNNKMLLDTFLSSVNKETTRYFCIDDNLNKIKIVNDLKPKNSDLILPVRITGLYTLIMCLKYLAEHENVTAAKKLFDSGAIINSIQVLPPGVRPIATDPSKPDEVKLTELTSNYNSIVGLNKTNYAWKDNIKLEMEDFTEKIKFAFRNQLLDQEIIENNQLIFDTMAARYQYYVNKVYSTAFETVSGKTGLIRESILGKTIEFSARSVVRVDPSINPYEIKVSRKILYKLWAPYFGYYLTRVRKFDYDYVFEEAISKSYEENKKLFADFLDWMCDDTDMTGIEPKNIEVANEEQEIEEISVF